MTLLLIYERVNHGGFIIRQKTGPDSKQKFKKNMGISLDYNPKDFKLSGYEGLSYGKICHKEPKTNIVCSGLQLVSNRHLSHFMLILDCEISV